MEDTNIQTIYQKTIAFAAEYHGQQKMPNGLPYIVHLSNVAMESRGVKSNYFNDDLVIFTKNYSQE